MALCFGTMLAMKMQHSDITAMIPRTALQTRPGKPDYVPLDPTEIMKALSN